MLFFFIKILLIKNKKKLLEVLKLHMWLAHFYWMGLL